MTVCNTCNIDKIKEMMQSKALCKRCFWKTVYIKSASKINNLITYTNFREEDWKYYVTRIFTGKESLVSDIVSNLTEIITLWDSSISTARQQSALREIKLLKRTYLNKEKSWLNIQWYIK